MQKWLDSRRIDATLARRLGLVISKQLLDFLKRVGMKATPQELVAMCGGTHSPSSRVQGPQHCPACKDGVADLDHLY
eukprot:8559835-Alexandrium_andersonii.AAC.1